MSADTAAVKADTAAIKAKADNLPAAPASTGDAQAGATVPAADVVTNTNTRDVVGAKDDTALATPLTAAVTATASLMRYIKTLMARTIAPSAADNTTAAASASMYETLGRKDDAAIYAKSTTKSVHAHLKGLVDAADIVSGALTTATSGSSVADTSLAAYPSSSFVGWTIRYLTGVNAGLVGYVSAFTTGTGAMTIATNASGLATPSVGDTYLLIPAPPGLRAPAADSTSNGSMNVVVGSKADTAATVVNTTQGLIAYVKGIFAAIGIWTKDAYATIVCATAAETDLVAQVTITKPTHVIAKLDLTNLTVNATIKVYHAMGAAGATLTAENSRAWVFASDAKVVPLDFWTDGDYKITITTGAEGANRNVYVRHSRRVSQ
jgi:hypothetical protein